MKRLTCDNPKDNLETALNLFYIKDHETWVRGGGPAPEYADISLFDFIRRAVAAHIPDADLPEDNDDLSMMMAEWLMDDIESAEGILSLLYTAAWTYAELRYRLAAYEDLMDLDRLREIVLAEQEGRLTMRARGVGHKCGSCDNFIPGEGTGPGYCKLRKSLLNNYGGFTGREFRPYKSRKACSNGYVPKGGDK